MQILILIDEDGKEQQFSMGIKHLVDYIRQHKVETIVVGELTDGNVDWEKQFSEVTVMPSSFGKQAEAATGLGQIPARRW